MPLEVGMQSVMAQAFIGAETFEDTVEATFSSSNARVASVSANGVITAVGEGTATVTARLRGRTRTINVTVGEGAEPVVNPTAIRLRSSARVAVGSNIILYPVLTPANAGGLVWSSANTDVATVDANGVVRGLRAGTSRITLSSADGRVRATTTVTVVAAVARPATGVRLNRTTLDINTGQSSRLTATVSPSNATLNGVGWFSSDPSVATVDASGNVRGVSAGTAVITAVTDGGLTVTCTVTVSVRVTGVTLSSTTLSMRVGGTSKLTATIQPAEAAGHQVVWRSSNASIASVSADGTITAHRRGTVTITATAGGRSVTCRVTVTP
jgi:uncharacterized protein YjdB